MNYWALKKEIDGGVVRPVYLFVGEEDFLADELVKKILQVTVEEGTEDFNLDIFYASEVDIGDVINAASAYPMMAEKRSVVLKEIHKLSPAKLATLSTYVAKPLDTTCLILMGENLNLRLKAAKQLRDRATFVQMKPLYENQASEWMKTYLRERNIEISDEATRLLLASAGTSLRALVREVEKIQINIKPRRTIEEEDVAASAGITRQFSIFELCDAVGKKDINASLHILNHMMSAGESAPGLVSMLTRHFRILLKTRELLKRRQPEKTISQTIGVNPFFLKNYIQQSSNYTSFEIGRIFELLLDADITLKSSPQKPRLVLELLLMRVINGEFV